MTVWESLSSDSMFSVRQILVDDLLVYNGVLDKVPAISKTSVEVPYRTVLFTTDKELLKREHSTQIR
jgi:hypothetical protein